MCEYVYVTLSAAGVRMHLHSQACAWMHADAGEALELLVKTGRWLIG